VKVRLAGIDSPERGQAFGAKAKQALSGKVFGKTVQVKDRGKDKYDRTLGVVRLGEENVNEQLVRQGWAWWYRKYAPDNKTLEAAEAEARKAKRGLWADANPVPPWDWRQAQRAKTDGKQPAVTGYWLNTSTGVRHNSNCANYRNTKRGRECGPGEGKACGICGG